jgi:transcriptional regulator with GAF, ATPase, and Fis domain
MRNQLGDAAARAFAAANTRAKTSKRGRARPSAIASGPASLHDDRVIEDVTRAQPTRVVQYAKALLAVTKGPDLDKRLEVTNVPVRIGSSSECTLVLRDDTVSRQHCQLVTTPEGVRVSDEGSTNGIRVGAIKVVDAIFAEPFQIQLGKTELSITPLSGKVEREQSVSERFGDLLGRSAPMREMFADLMRIAPTELSVLVEGETGTGKELVADSIHRASSRAGGAYVVFDCSAVSPSLAESELFGHEKGAFTGAVASRAGVFEQADGGSIFLDELGELPKDLQPKLLRVLEKGELRRVGGNRTIPVDVRVISATNRNLRAEVDSGNFREDLYYRVSGTKIRVPPLRERLDDLPLLVEHFLQRMVPPRHADQVPPHLWDMLRSYRWPGNVRELKHAVERMLVLPERVLGTTPAWAVPTAATDADDKLDPWRIARRQAADDFERGYLQRVLSRTDGNVTRAAAIAEISRQMVQKLMKKHAIDGKD